MSRHFTGAVQPLKLGLFAVGTWDQISRNSRDRQTDVRREAHAGMRGPVYCMDSLPDSAGQRQTAPATKLFVCGVADSSLRSSTDHSITFPRLGEIEACRQGALFPVVTYLDGVDVKPRHQAYM